MVLIVSAAIGAPTDGMVHTFSGWPAQADILPAVPMAAAARALPLVETQPRPESEDLACTVAAELKVPAEPAYCVFVGGADRKWRCKSKFVRHCIDDYPSTEE